MKIESLVFIKCQSIKKSWHHPWQIPPPPLELSLPHHSDMSSQHHFKKKLTSNADFV